MNDLEQKKIQDFIEFSRNMLRYETGVDLISGGYVNIVFLEEVDGELFFSAQHGVSSDCERYYTKEKWWISAKILFDDQPMVKNYRSIWIDVMETFREHISAENQEKARATRVDELETVV